MQNLKYLFKHRNLSFNSRDIPVQSKTPYTDAVKSRKMPKDGHVKRPLNSFMVYSKYERAKITKKNPKMNHREISILLGQQWNTLSPDERIKYQDESKSLDRLHNVQYPTYRYAPTRKRSSATRKVKCSSKRATEKSEKCKKSTSLNLETGNISHLSDITASVNQNGPTNSSGPLHLKRPRCTPKRTLQQEQLKVEPLQNQPLPQELLHEEETECENIECAELERAALDCEEFKWVPLEAEPSDLGPLQWIPLHHELLQPNPLQREISQRHPLGPLLGQSSAQKKTYNRLPCDNASDDEDALLSQLLNINDVLE